jgi:hypothetical protein
MSTPNLRLAMEKSRGCGRGFIELHSMKSSYWSIINKQRENGEIAGKRPDDRGDSQEHSMEAIDYGIRTCSVGWRFGTFW